MLLLRRAVVAAMPSAAHRLAETVPAHLRATVRAAVGANPNGVPDAAVVENTLAAYAAAVVGEPDAATGDLPPHDLVGAFLRAVDRLDDAIADPAERRAARDGYLGAMLKAALRVAAAMSAQPVADALDLRHARPTKRRRPEAPVGFAPDFQPGVPLPPAAAILVPAPDPPPPPPPPPPPQPSSASESDDADNNGGDVVPGDESGGDDEGGGGGGGQGPARYPFAFAFEGRDDATRIHALHEPPPERGLKVWFAGNVAPEVHAAARDAFAAQLQIAERRATYWAPCRFCDAPTLPNESRRGQVTKCCQNGRRIVPDCHWPRWVDDNDAAPAANDDGAAAAAGPGDGDDDEEDADILAVDPPPPGPDAGNAESDEDNAAPPEAPARFVPTPVPVTPAFLAARRRFRDAVLACKAAIPNFDRDCISVNHAACRATIHVGAVVDPVAGGGGRELGLHGDRAGDAARRAPFDVAGMAPRDAGLHVSRGGNVRLGGMTYTLVDPSDARCFDTAASRATPLARLPAAPVKELMKALRNFRREAARLHAVPDEEALPASDASDDSDVAGDNAAAAADGEREAAARLEEGEAELPYFPSPPSSGCGTDDVGSFGSNADEFDGPPPPAPPADEGDGDELGHIPALEASDDADGPRAVQLEGVIMDAELEFEDPRAGQGEAVLLTADPATHHVLMPALTASLYDGRGFPALRAFMAAEASTEARRRHAPMHVPFEPAIFPLGVPSGIGGFSKAYGGFASPTALPPPNGGAPYEFPTVLKFVKAVLYQRFRELAHLPRLAEFVALHETCRAREINRQQIANQRAAAEAYGRRLLATANQVQAAQAATDGNAATAIRRVGKSWALPASVP